MIMCGFTKSPIRFLPLFCLLLFWGNIVFPQETSGPGPILDKLRPPLPKGERSGTYPSLKDEIAHTLIGVLHRLGVDEVLVAVRRDTNETIFRSSRAARRWFLREFKNSKEAIVLTRVTAFIDTVQMETDEAGLVDLVRQGDRLVETTIEIAADFLSVDSMEILGSLVESGVGRHANPDEARKRAIRDLELRLERELKRIYWFSLEMRIEPDGSLTVPKGKNHDMFTGLTFHIVEPDRVYEDSEGEFIEAGGEAGFARVVQVDRDSSTLQVTRQWRPFYPEAWLVEYPYPIYSFSLAAMPPVRPGFYAVGLTIESNPMNLFGWGFQGRFIRLDDSRNSTDNGFGFGAFGIYRWYNSTLFNMGAAAGVDVDIPFRKDDNGQTVSTFVPSIFAAATFEFPLSSHFDFFAWAGYRFAIESDVWDYSNEEESIPAFWIGDPPKADNDGILISVGFRYLLF